MFVTNLSNLIKRKMHNIIQTSDLLNIFNAGVSAVQPNNLIKQHFRVKNNEILLNNTVYNLKKPCYIVGFGKAVSCMALELEILLGKWFEKGICSIPVGSLSKNYRGSKITFIEGAENNLPDDSSLKAALEIKNICLGLQEDDFVIILISGGGSALLSLPVAGISLKQKQSTILNISRAGADIIELNTVRKKLSQLKGGGLASAIYPARCVSLILSDVIGDPINIIASGPTAENQDNPDAAWNIILKYNLVHSLDESVLKVLKNGDKATKIFDPTMVSNIILGNNQLACDEAQIKAHELGYETFILSTKLNQSVNKLALMYMELLLEITRENYLIRWFEKFKIDPNKGFSDLKLTHNVKLCLISSGEPTLQVMGTGKGGRNQQLVVEFARQIRLIGLEQFKSLRDFGFLSCGTDGIDGPTDAAGGEMWLADIRDLNMDQMESVLETNDCYNFLSKYKDGKCLVKTGHTGTNVMDLHVLIINPM